MNALVFTAHPDDEALSCGASLWQLSQAGHHITIVFANDGIPSRDGFDYHLRAEAEQAAAIIGAQRVEYLGFPDQRLDVVPCAVIVDKLRALELPSCEILFTHVSTDCNQDHLSVHNAALVYARPTDGYRPMAILGCEIPSSSEWGAVAFQPNLWVALSEEALAAKQAALQCYDKELRQYPHPRSAMGVEITARRRGLDCGAEFAEAFQLIRGYGLCL